MYLDFGELIFDSGFGVLGLWRCRLPSLAPILYFVSFSFHLTKFLFFVLLFYRFSDFSSSFHSLLWSFDVHVVWAFFWIIFQIGALIGFVLIGIAAFKVGYSPSLRAFFREVRSLILFLSLFFFLLTSTSTSTSTLARYDIL